MLALKAYPAYSLPRNADWLSKRLLNRLTAVEERKEEMHRRTLPMRCMGRSSAKAAYYISYHFLSVFYIKITHDQFIPNHFLESLSHFYLVSLV